MSQNTPARNSRGVKQVGAILEVDLDLVRFNPRQPREMYTDAEVGVMIRDIKKGGQLQPIMCVERGGRYEVVNGETRLRALRKLAEKDPEQFGTIKVILVDPAASERDLYSMSVRSNRLQNPFSSLEEARILQELTEKYGYSIEDAAEHFGRREHWAVEMLRINQLQPEVQEMMSKRVPEADRLGARHGIAMVGVPRTEQLRLAKQTLKQRLTLSQVRHRVRQLAAQGKRRDDIGGRRPSDAYEVLISQLNAMDRNAQMMSETRLPDLESMFLRRGEEDLEFILANRIPAIHGHLDDLSQKLARLLPKGNRIRKIFKV